MTRNTRGLKRTAGPGRRKGVPNKVTVAAKDALNRIVDNPAYMAALEQRMVEGKAGAMEPVIWYLAKGKPVERHEVGAPGDFSKMSTADLLQFVTGELAAFGVKVKS